MIVLCIHSMSGLLGYARVSWPLGLPSISTGPVVLLKAYGRMLVHAVHGLVTATGIALVEELLFRSWLPEEIAVDLGYYHAIMISGVAFSMIHGYVYLQMSLLKILVQLAADDFVGFTF